MGVYLSFLYYTHAIILNVLILRIYVKVLIQIMYKTPLIDEDTYRGLRLTALKDMSIL